MVYTVTFNPSIDYYIKVKNFKMGRLNRAEGEIKLPGGKGINVSRVLKKLGKDSTVFGFAGGFTGEYIENILKKEGINTDFIKILGDTRINVKIQEIQEDNETEINAEGPNIREEDLKKLLKKIECVGKGDFIVLSGNLQKNIPKDIYCKIQNIAVKNKAKVIVDTTGKSLILTLKNKPFLIKPNKYELGQIFNVDIKDEEDIIYYGKKLLDLGAENVIVSMGGNGAILIYKEGVYRAYAPCGKVINSVGAGDSLIGGFVAKYLEKPDIVYAFKFGVASGSATAFSMDLCTKKDVEKLLGQVSIERLI